MRFEEAPLTVCERASSFWNEKRNTMKQTGFYKLSQAYIDLIAKLGGIYKDSKERPVYCCLQDRKNPDIYWAIPTGDVSHRTPEQIERVRKYCELPERDIRSCFYYIGHTNRPAIFKISNVLPVTENDLAGEYISQGNHLMLKSKTQIDAITRKLSRILFDEQRHPNKYEQHITSIYNHLVEMLRQDKVLERAAEIEKKELLNQDDEKPSAVASLRSAQDETQQKRPTPQIPTEHRDKDEPSL
jgi:hypothetical protein